MGGVGRGDRGMGGGEMGGVGRGDGRGREGRWEG